MYVSDEWIAGFVEGDGCFSTNRQRGGKYVYPKIEVHQKNPEPLEAMTHFGWKVTTNGKLGVAYCVGKNAQAVFDRISPWLSAKRLAQAEDNLFVYSGRKEAHGLDWFAGYYEAEGCVYTKTNGQIRKDGTQKKFCAMTISQYYSDETSRFCQKAVGTGRIAGPYMAYGERRAYSFNLFGQEAIETVEKIQHMLSQEKIAQLEKVKEQL